MTQLRDTTSQCGQVIQANGAHIYYESHGQGQPLILLHAGTLSSESWRPYLASFAERYRVITPDSRGHGRSDNPAGEMSYRLLADDMAAFVQALELHKPLIAGYSDGGQIALEIGMRYPDLPQCLIVGGACVRITAATCAWVRGVFGGEEGSDVDIEYFTRNHPDWAALLEQLYGADSWKPLLVQIKSMWTMPLNYGPDDFSQVRVPTLVLTGDRDELIPLEESVEMYRLLPNAEFSVVPGADHGAFFSAKVALFQSLMLDFLDRQNR